MKKTLLTAGVVSVWLFLLLWAHQAGLTRLGMDGVMQLIQTYKVWAPCVFVGLFFVRMVLFIPGSVCILIGSLLFSPIQAVLLSLLGIVLAETMVYLVGRWLTGSALYDKMMSKYPKVGALLEQHQAKFLAFVVACPFMLTDAVCFTAAATGMKYRTFLLSVITGAIPMVILYTVAGKAVMASISMFVAVAAGIFVLVVVAVFIWKKWSLSTEENITQMQA